MIRYGKTIVFKKGITRAQAEKALASIQNVLDLEEFFEPLKVEEFEDEHGSPVFYIP